MFSHVKKSLNCDCPFSLHVTNRKKLQWDESGGLHAAGYFYSEVEDLNTAQVICPAPTSVFLLFIPSSCDRVHAASEC